MLPRQNCACIYIAKHVAPAAAWSTLLSGGDEAVSVDIEWVISLLWYAYSTWVLV